MNWVLTILGITALVVLHEFGHFAAAKAVGMRVERFSLFFPPKLVGIRRGETEYMIGAIPAGGYVKITGMSPKEEIPPEVAHRAYYRQPVWKRLVVIGAGPMMNLLVAFAIFWVVDATSATRLLPDRVRIAAVQQGRPAAAVLRSGDVLVAVNGKRVHVSANGEANYIPVISAQRCPGRQSEGCAVATTVQLTVLRAGKRMSFAVVPRYDNKLKRALIGITAAPVLEGESAGQAAVTSVDEMWRVTSTTVSRISKIFVSEKARKQVHSLVGVSDITSQEFGYSAPAAFYLLAIISLSLAIINLFPFLPLDGGHIFWALAEKIRGRAISFSVMERASVIGVALVLVLFLIGFSNDVHTLSNGGFHTR
jgi:regulator of sigma E protease